MLLELQVASAAESLPTEQECRLWAETALAATDVQRQAEMEMTVRIVDEAESAGLNLEYRGKQGPTNVLSFEADLPPELDIPLLGDLVICAPVVEREAREQEKRARAHWAHMVVHGVLHLCGYDHLDDAEAEQMESLERVILASMSYADPY